jgi:Cu(I)/Ag(I) efflux system membrane protein CusA/SilA
VFPIIFLLLYKTFNSFKEASHAILAVPFALSGGVFLLKLLGYNFSVAVSVSFIALFGTAVQTGVVMVIYLEEAVERKKVAMGALTVQGLREAVMEGNGSRIGPRRQANMQKRSDCISCCTTIKSLCSVKRIPRHLTPCRRLQI